MAYPPIGINGNRIFEMDSSENRVTMGAVYHFNLLISLLTPSEPNYLVNCLLLTAAISVAIGALGAHGLKKYPPYHYRSSSYSIFLIFI